MRVAARVFLGDRMMNTLRIALLAAAAGFALAPQFAAAQESARVQPAGPVDTGGTNSGTSHWRISIGGNYSTGDYGDTQSTKVYAVPVGLRYTTGNFNIRVSVPYVFLDGPGSLIDTPQGRDGGSGSSGNGGGDDGSGGSDNSGSGNSGSGGSGSGSGGSGSGGGEVTGGTASQRSNGIGDVSIAAGYSLALTDALYLDAGARIKLPTASRRKRLGTGEVDVTTSLDLSYDIGALSLYAGGRRKFAGNSATSAFRDTWGAGGGLSVRAGPGVSVGADYDWQQASTAGNGDISEVTGWASFRLNRKLRLQVFASTGLSTNSTDFAGGMTLSYRF